MIPARRVVVTNIHDDGIVVRMVPEAGLPAVEGVVTWKQLRSWLTQERRWGTLEDSLDVQRLDNINFTTPAAPVRSLEDIGRDIIQGQRQK